jgi:hypothetical protein
MLQFTRSFLKIKWVRALALALGLLSLAGCFESTSATTPISSYTPPGLDDRHGPLPTKDEVLLINGHPLSVTDYFDIRRRVGPAVSRDAVLWIGEASLLLQDDWRAKGEQLDPANSVVLSAYASGVFTLDQVKATGLKSIPPARGLFTEIEAQLKKAEVRQNHILLAELK